MEQYDLAGLDDTWQGSEADSCEQSDDGSDSDDVIPQLDGQADEKPKCKFTYVLFLFERR